MKKELTIALAKGRLLEQCVPLFAKAGYEPDHELMNSRRLVIDSNQANVRFVIVRSMDVPTFVEHGGADIGVVGKDILLEYNGQNLYEMLDLNIGRCRLMVAGWPDFAWRNKHRLKVATKYGKTAKAFFASAGVQADVIPLYGSMELAPLINMAECIVDLVETGNTLKANGLEPQETVADISARLIVSKAAMRLKHQTIKPLLNELKHVIPTV